MTNYCFFTRFKSSRSLAAALTLVAALPMASAQTSGLRPSNQIRLNVPAAASSAPVRQQQADFIVAVVNSEPITNNDVRVKLKRTEMQMVEQGINVPSRSDLGRQVLERLISDKAQLQLARATGLRIDDSAVDNAVQAIARQNQISADELQRRLKTDGIDYTHFQSELRDELLVTRLRQRELEARVTVTEQDVDQFLRDQLASNDQSSLVLNLADILIAVPENASPAQVVQSQTKAQQLLDRARTGADFSALATEFSGSATRSNGGQMGLRSADRYPTLFIEATQGLATGSLAGPVRSAAGFHILKVIEKRQADMPGAAVTQTHARHILLRLTPQQNEAAATAKLAEFKKRILAGKAEFAALARENSEDASAKEGGDLGWVNPGMFVPEFEKVMNGLAPNQISEPLTSRFGVHLIQVIERRETQLSKREQREMVRNLLREKKQDEAYVQWAQEIRGRAYVEYREPPQ